MFVLEIGRKQYPTIAGLTLRYAEIVSAFAVMQDIIDHGENADELWFKLEKETPVTEEIEEEESETEETTQIKDTMSEPDPQEDKPEKNLNKIRELLAAGQKKKDIAEYFCVLVGTIYNWINELNELDEVFDKAGVSK